MKSWLYIYLVLALFSAEAIAQDHNSQVYFILPDAFGQQPELSQAVMNMEKKLILSNTNYTHLDTFYTITNLQPKLYFNDARQKSRIPVAQRIEIYGGTIQFLYDFNWTKTKAGQTVRGYGIASVWSDSVNYTKQLQLTSTGYQWRLGSLSPILIHNSCNIKRLQPYTPQDAKSIQVIFERIDSQISPVNIQNQTLDQANKILPDTLRQVINHEIISSQFTYNYTSPTKGPMVLQIFHHNYGSSITPQFGARYTFRSQIKNWGKDICENIVAPTNPQNQSIRGGVQIQHMTCFYQGIANYMFQKGWLNSAIDSNWEVNAFQFYAGDLYDVIKNLYKNVSSRALLNGQCIAQKNVTLQPQKSSTLNHYQLRVNYECYLQTKDLQQQEVNITKFTSLVNFVIEAKARTVDLQFSIVKVNLLETTYMQTGGFSVAIKQLADFKVQQVLKSFQGMQTFGTGFPNIPLKIPKTKVNNDYVIYYDEATIKPSAQTFSQ